jgi:hypothetical protein
MIVLPVLKVRVPFDLWRKGRSCKTNDTTLMGADWPEAHVTAV